MDVIEELIARGKIHQLADRYALAVDGKDIDALAALFVEDVENGRYGPGPRWRQDLLRQRPEGASLLDASRRQPRHRLRR